MRKAKVRHRFGLTEAGAMTLRGVGFIALAALVVPVFGVFSALVSVLFVALVAGFLVRPKIEVRGSLPDHVVAGQTAKITYTLRNMARLPAYHLLVRFRTLPASVEQVGDGCAVAYLARGATVEVTITIRPTRRGYYPLTSPICESSFPFNLFRFGSGGNGEQTLAVFPSFSRLHLSSRAMSRHVHAGGAQLVGRMGIAPEYIGNRPFLPGDLPRRIDARAWARLSVPATKEYDDDIDTYGALILDTRVADGRLRTGTEEIKELEAAVSLSASVAFSLQDHCLMDIFLAGPDLHELGGRSPLARIDRIHGLLAGVEAAREYSLDTVGPRLADRLYEISHVVFVLLRWGETYRPLLEAADRAGCHCTVVLVGDGETADAGAQEIRWFGDVQRVEPDDVLDGRIERL
jgi:uncharacterized protein (DUF58 family)